MATAFVQSTSFTSNGTPVATSFAVTMGAPVTPGNILAMYVGWGNGTAANFSSLTLSTLETPVNVTSNSGNSDAHMLFYVPNLSGGTPTITVQLLNGRGYRYIGVEEISGVNNAAPLDKSVLTTGAAPGTGADAAKTANVTTTANGDYLFSGIYIDNTVTMTTSPGTGFTSSNIYFGGADAAPAATEHQIQGTATTTAGTWTLSNSQAFTAGLLAFFASTTSPSTTGINFYNNFQLLGVM